MPVNTTSAFRTGSERRAKASLQDEGGEGPIDEEKRVRAKREQRRRDNTRNPVAPIAHPFWLVRFLGASIVVKR